jgi:hypothetical protein
MEIKSCMREGDALSLFPGAACIKGLKVVSDNEK